MARTILLKFMLSEQYEYVFWYDDQHKPSEPLLDHRIPAQIYTDRTIPLKYEQLLLETNSDA